MGGRRSGIRERPASGKVVCKQQNHAWEDGSQHGNERQSVELVRLESSKAYSWGEH